MVYDFLHSKDSLYKEAVMEGLRNGYEVVDIVSLGAVGDGLHDNSKVFEQAFSKENVHVVVPKGMWLTGPITLRSNTVLELEEGSVVIFIDDPNLYEPVYSRWEGVRCWCMHPCVYSQDSSNVAVIGKGILDGNGRSWWEAAVDKKRRNASPETSMELRLAELNVGYESQPGGGGGRRSQYLRPPLIQFNNCTNVELRGVFIANSPCWTVHPVFCTGVDIIGVKISNPSDSPNTDAIDVDSCVDVRIIDCAISVGDDAICLKSGNGQDGVDAARPTRNVVVDGCYVRNAHGGAVIGSETAAGIKDVVFRNCTFEGTDRGVRIKTRRGRGGVVEDLLFTDIKVDSCLCPITFNMYYKCGTDEDWPFSLEPMPVDSVTPSIRNVTIEDMKAVDCRSSAGFIVGLPESPISNVVVRDCSFQVSTDGGAGTDEAEMFRGLPHVEGRGIRVLNADVRFENVEVIGVEEPYVYE